MMAVRLTDEARTHFADLPSTIKARVLSVFERLQKWPEVSGAKPMRKQWAGHSRIRVGDWRVIFRVVSPEVIVVRIQHRRDVYEDG
jgi:mRNA-degrading endonuclease RelE of RelBE toxin-antitoxin system